MESRHGLQGIEQRSWQRVFEDGIWDLAIGAVLLTFGLSILTDFVPIAAIVPAVLIPSLRQFKRRVTEPRIGRVQFGSHRKRQMGRIPLLLLSLVVAGLAVFAFLTWSLSGTPPGWVQAIREHFVLVIGVVWSGALILGGLFLGFARLHAYAILLMGALLAVDLTPGFHLGVALSAVGGSILITGFFLLIRFVKRYPRIDAEDEGTSDD